MVEVVRQPTCYTGASQFQVAAIKQEGGRCARSPHNRHPGLCNATRPRETVRPGETESETGDVITAATLFLAMMPVPVHACTLVMFEH